MSEILEGRLRAGERLVIQDLAARFAVSPTPIREALVALQGIGVIDLAPNRGAIVRSVGASEVREMSEVRRLLEAEATRGACGRLPLDLRRELTDRFEELRQPVDMGESYYDRARAADSRLHDAIASHCGNAFLAQELNRLKLLFRVFRDLSYAHHQRLDDNQRLIDEAEEHLEIVRLLNSGQGRAAARAMARHIRLGVRSWTRCLPQ